MLDEDDDEVMPMDIAADLQRLKNATAVLMEHFDSVQIFTTRHDQGVSSAITHGGGNWYARRGQIDEWVAKQTNES